MNCDLRRMAAIQYDDLVSMRHIPGESDASRAQDAALLIQLHERAKILCFFPTGFFGSRIAARVAGVRHVVILKPAFAGLIAYRTVDRMMEEQELHGVSDGLLDAWRGGSHDHSIGDRSRAGRNKFRRLFHFNQTHSATALDANVGVIAIPRNLNSNLVGQLNDGLARRRIVGLVIERDLGHKQLRLTRLWPVLSRSENVFV